MDLEKLMSDLWKKYLETKDVKYLAEACEKAPFFGQKQMGKEISKTEKDQIYKAVNEVEEKIAKLKLSIK